MIVFYYILFGLEIFVKAWVDSQAFSWGAYYHLADVTHYIIITMIFAWFYLNWSGKVKELAILALSYLLLRFAMFDYWLNMLRGKEFDYNLFMADLFGGYIGTAKVLALILMIVLGIINYVDRKYKMFEL